MCGTHRVSKDRPYHTSSKNGYGFSLSVDGCNPKKPRGSAERTSVCREEGAQRPHVTEHSRCWRYGIDGIGIQTPDLNFAVCCPHCHNSLSVVGSSILYSHHPSRVVLPGLYPRECRGRGPPSEPLSRPSVAGFLRVYALAIRTSGTRADGQSAY